MILKLLNQYNAYNVVLKKLFEKEKFIPQLVMGINKDEKGNPRYHIVFGSYNIENIFIKFSREPYLSGVGGFRESVNRETGVKMCAKYNVKRLFFIYPNGYILSTSFNNFMEKADKRSTNIENKDVYTILLKDLDKYDGDVPNW